jgi:hypothetical protein
MSCIERVWTWDSTILPFESHLQQSESSFVAVVTLIAIQP